MSIKSPPMSPNRTSGFTLIEVIMFIVIISVALTGVLAALNLTTKSSADPLIRKQMMTIAETLVDPGVVEIGYADEMRYTVTLIEQPAQDGQAGLTFDQNTVFVVTGAAGGITSAIVEDLATASGGVFYLLDLVKTPSPNDPHIRLFRQGRELGGCRNIGQRELF